MKIKTKFLSFYHLHKNKTYYASTIHDNLALIILFDQFPRNMFRNTPQSFMTDKKVLDLAKYAIDKGDDKNLNVEERKFLYMPFMHSEDIDEQSYAVILFEELGEQNSLDFAIRHFNIIKRFNRFPHRNHILGRQSTIEEQKFLLEPGSSF